MWVVIDPHDGPQPFASECSETRTGTVVVHGRGFHLPNGMKVPLEVHPGDVVHYFGDERPIGQGNYVAIKYENIICAEVKDESPRTAVGPFKVDEGCHGA